MKSKRLMKSWKTIGKVPEVIRKENNNKLLTNDIYIPSIQAKDIFSGNVKLYNKNNEIRIKKYISTLDYSKEQVKLREVFATVYPDKKLITPLYNCKNEIIKLFSDYVISVSFEYNTKQWNRVNLYDKAGKHKAYIKYGYDITMDDFNDCAAVKEGKVVGVITEEDVEQISEEVYSPFYTKDGQYHMKDSCNKDMYSIYEDEELDLNSDNMRLILYNKGFDYNDIHYIRYKRANGSSRQGKCLFIDERLYPQMREWELMNLKVVSSQPIDLAGEEAYISLTLSGCNKEIIHINKEEILIVDEKTDTFTSNCISVNSRDNGLYAEEKEVSITNNLFDGESLIEADLCHGYGMCLLRERMCKTAAFATRIQQFFKDKNITEVSQLNGFTLAADIKQIKLILNPTCIKYLKFDKSPENWLNMIDGNFYIVKHEHESFFNNKLVQAHYQLLNTLQLSYEETIKLLRPSFQYLNLISTDPTVFKNHINMTATDVNYVSLDNLLTVSDKAFYSAYCKGLKRDMRKSARRNLKNGHVLIHGNYSVLFGNPLHYLYHAIGRFDECQEFTGAQCMTVNRNFEKEKVVLCRSPHVACGNLALLDNVYVPEIDKYFALTDNIVCLNAIGENIMERLSSCDYDSDQAIITNERIIVDAVIKNYDKFGVPTNAVKPKASNEYYYTMNDLAELDNSIARQSSTIGEIINFSQVLQSLMWDNINCKWKTDNRLVSELIKDCAVLDVMSCICIDSAKKDYSNVDLKKELQLLRDKYHKWIVNKDGHTTKPTFFKQIETLKHYDKPKDRYKYYNTTMCHLVRAINSFKFENAQELNYTLADILTINIPCNKDNIYKQQIHDIISKAVESKKIINKIMQEKNENYYSDYTTTVTAFNDYVHSLNINATTAYKLIRLLDTDHEKLKMVKRMITTALFNHGVIKKLASKTEKIENNYYSFYKLEQISNSEYAVADYIFYGIGYKKSKVSPCYF